MVKNSLLSLELLKRSCMIGMEKNSMFSLLFNKTGYQPDRRATYIKGDPYIRDMRHTAYV